MPKKFSPTEAQRRAIDKALARMDKRRRKKERKAIAKAHATNHRRRKERKAVRAQKPQVTLKPESEAHAVHRLRLKADRHDRSAIRWRASADRAEAQGDADKARKHRYSANSFEKRARLVREQADEREARIGKPLDLDPVKAEGVGGLEGFNATRRKLGLPAWQVLLTRMEPDTWYVVGEMRALMPEYAKSTIKAMVMGPMLRGGWLERAGNPGYDVSDPVKAMATGRYLYRMSIAAAEKAQDWREALGECLGA